jgi:hypothetical protein
VIVTVTGGTPIAIKTGFVSRMKNNMRRKNEGFEKWDG